MLALLMTQAIKNCIHWWLCSAKISIVTHLISLKIFGVKQSINFLVVDARTFVSITSKYINFEQGALRFSLRITLVNICFRIYSFSFNMRTGLLDQVSTHDILSNLELVFIKVQLHYLIGINLLRLRSNWKFTQY